MAAKVHQSHLEVCGEAANGVEAMEKAVAPSGLT
jgi:hypothetical protein